MPMDQLFDHFKNVAGHGNEDGNFVSDTDNSDFENDVIFNELYSPISMEEITCNF